MGDTLVFCFPENRWVSERYLANRDVFGFTTYCGKTQHDHVYDRTSAGASQVHPFMCTQGFTRES